MGEAARRRRGRVDAYALGKPWKPERPECPACGSRRVRRFTADEIQAAADGHGLAGLGACDFEACLACKAIWEAFPVDGYVEDPVCAEPCDNCAFRPGSPEQRDPERWRELLLGLKRDDAGVIGWFYCHKGVPIDMTKGPGNFLFPQKPVMMDGEPLKKSDGTVVLMYDVKKMRSCSGYLRMVWARDGKRAAVATATRQSTEEDVP